jgi:hypothetical protein
MDQKEANNYNNLKNLVSHFGKHLFSWYFFKQLINFKNYFFHLEKNPTID